MISLRSAAEVFRKPTKKEAFLRQMNLAVPWKAILDHIAPFYPKGERGRPTVGLERMLRFYFLQNWYSLSDEAVEDAVNDTPIFAEFVGIDLSIEPVPDATTLCRFRQFLQKHNLSQAIFDEINAYLSEDEGIRVQQGTIVDATILKGPSSTKNKEKKRDPEMKSTRKGNQYFFGMKLHTGTSLTEPVDGHGVVPLIHHLVLTPASVHDSRPLLLLLFGWELWLYGDSAYIGQEERVRATLAAIQGSETVEFESRVHERAFRGKPLTQEQKESNNKKSQTRCFGEFPYHTIKCVFGFKKLPYKGLEKNLNRLFVLCGLSNIFAVRHRLGSQCA